MDRLYAVIIENVILFGIIKKKFKGQKEISSGRQIEAH